MTEASPEVEALAAERLAADESRIGGASRPGVRRSRSAARGAPAGPQPSPWLIGGFLVGAMAARVGGRGGRLVGSSRSPRRSSRRFPLIEWVVHVAVLHWRPRDLGPIPRQLAARPQAPRAPRRSARPAAGVHPDPGAGLAAAGLRPPRVAGDADRVQHAHAAGERLRDHVRLRVGALPRSTATTGRAAAGSGTSGATTGSTTTRTSTTGSGSPPPAPPTGCCTPARTPPTYPRHRRCGHCTVAKDSRSRRPGGRGGPGPRGSARPG